VITFNIHDDHTVKLYGPGIFLHRPAEYLQMHI